MTPYKKRLKKIKNELPKWLKAIPESLSHGSGTLQKRLWRLTSDFVRIRDTYLYNGKCVATGRFYGEWQNANAGHFFSYSICENMFKFDVRNIHAQSAMSNKLSSMSDGNAFGDELDKRYGKGYCEFLEKENLRHKDLMISDELVIDEIKKRLHDFIELEEMPEYVKRAIELYA